MNDPTLQAYYSARAREYDQVYAKPERQPDLRAIERWLPAALGSRAVLELACGTGYWTQFLAPVATRLVAMDASAAVLDIARSRVTSGPVAFVRGDAYRLPFAAGRFEAAFAGFWFSHVPRARVAEFLGGLHRTLRPGAKVVLLDNRFVAGSSTPISGHDDDGNTYQLRRLADGATHRVLKNFPSRSELRATLAGVASELSFHAWQHYWAVDYLVAAP